MPCGGGSPERVLRYHWKRAELLRGELQRIIIGGSSFELCKVRVRLGLGCGGQRPGRVAAAGGQRGSVAPV